MNFGWINIFGAGIVILLLLPNIVYAIKNRGETNLCTNRFMNGIEQIGRYACIVLMWLPLLVWETGRYMPDLDTIPVLCEELGITVNELLRGEKLDENYKEQAD